MITGSTTEKKHGVKGLPDKILSYQARSQLQVWISTCRLVRGVAGQSSRFHQLVIPGKADVMEMTPALVDSGPLVRCSFPRMECGHHGEDIARFSIDVYRAARIK